MIEYFEQRHGLASVAANDDHLLGQSEMRGLINAWGSAAHDCAYLYVASFPNGIIKIGISKDPPKRLTQLLSESVRSGNPMDRFHISASMHTKRDFSLVTVARKHERQALDMARASGTVAYGNEYFTGLSFEVATGFVDASVACFRAKHMTKVQA